MIKTIDEVIEMNRRLTAIATQVIDDVNEAGDKGDLYLLYDRMVANAQDFETALQIQSINAKGETNATHGKENR